MNIAIVGGCYGEKEAELGIPFAGTNAWILDNLLAPAGINRRECFCTTVFDFQVDSISKITGKKADGAFGLPPIEKGKYILPQYASNLPRLYKQLAAAKPNAIIALGPLATWALMHTSGIKQVRGVAALTVEPVSVAIGRPVKVIPTYDPASVLAQWTLRPIVIADLEKAKRQSATPELIRPSRKIWIRPTLDDLRIYEEQHMRGASIVACDIETKQEQITCIGFAPTPESAIVIPFFSESGQNYWATKQEELAAWSYIRRWLAEYKTIYQNGVYDMTFLWKYYGIPATQAHGDTMLLHHAMQIEMEKGLGFLGSVYTDEASWKFMSKGATHD